MAGPLHHHWGAQHLPPLCGWSRARDHGSRPDRGEGWNHARPVPRSQPMETHHVQLQIPPLLCGSTAVRMFLTFSRFHFKHNVLWRTFKGKAHNWTKPRDILSSFIFPSQRGSGDTEIPVQGRNLRSPDSCLGLHWDLQLRSLLLYTPTGLDQATETVLKSGQASLQAPLCPALCPVGGFLLVGSPASQLAQQKRLFLLLRLPVGLLPSTDPAKMPLPPGSTPWLKKRQGASLCFHNLEAGWSPQHECLLIAGSLTGQPGTLSDPGGQSGTGRARRGADSGRAKEAPLRAVPLT